MYIPYQFMEAAQDDRLRTAARDGRAAAVRRERRRLRQARRGAAASPSSRAHRVPPGSRLTARQPPLQRDQEEP